MEGRRGSSVFVLVTQLCPTHCNTVDWTPPGSSVHVHGDSTGKHNWSGLPLISPGALSNPGIEPRPPALQADSLHLTHLGSSATAQQASQGLTLSLPGPGEAPVDTCRPRITVDKVSSYSTHPGLEERL